MSTRTTLRPFQVLNASMAASATSDVTLLQGLSLVSYAIEWSGTSPVGSITLEFSNDYSINGVGETLDTGTWTTVPFDVNGVYATSAPVSGNTGNGFINVTLTGAYAARITYTRVSGTGTILATISGKVT